MNSLSQETWDLVIVGTDLPQALLALSFSRSGLKILHVDKNDYYGGSDAGLSLDEARKWAEEHTGERHALANVVVTDSQGAQVKPAASRSYTLSLSPQIIYASSAFLPALVTSRLHDQLDFLAVGSWWICKADGLQRIPSTREDVFADANLSRKDKMSLMRFLRSVVQDDALESDASMNDQGSLQDVLTTRFNITPSLHSALAALALALVDTQHSTFADAVSRIRRHMTSMNYFGPGFAAVYPKYAGNAEIAQVACRAGAVGGATYLLGHGVSLIDTASAETGHASVTLTDGTIVNTKHIVGGSEGLPKDSIQAPNPESSPDFTLLRSITIVSDPLKHLFPQTVDNGPTSAIAVLVIPDTEGSQSSDDTSSPALYLQVHSEDTGECPTGQCIIYGTLHLQDPIADLELGRCRLTKAIDRVLATTPPPSSAATTDPTTDSSLHPESKKPEILWSMTYTSTGARPTSLSYPTSTASPPFSQDATGRIISFPPRTQDLAFDDSVLTSVKAVWAKITDDLLGGDGGNGGERRGEFLCFEDRRGAE